MLAKTIVELITKGEWTYMVCVILLVFRNRSRKEDKFERELTACCRAGLKEDRAQAAADGDHNHFFSIFSSIFSVNAFKDGKRPRAIT